VVTVVLTMRLMLPPVGSLKEKRRIIKSLIARVRNDFNVSISEVGDNDAHRNATIGAAIVSNDSAFGHSVIAKVVDKVRGMGELEILDYSTETY